MKSKLLLLTVFMLLQQGCAFTGDPLQNSGLFIFGKWDGDLDGEYNPTGFSASEEQKHISGVCKDGAINDYSEKQKASGLVVFSAVCRSSRIGESADYKVEKTNSGVSITKIPSITFP